MIVIARLPGIYGNVNRPCPRAAPSDSGRFTAINPSLEPQTPIHEERGSGNIVYNECVKLRNVTLKSDRFVCN